MRCIEVQIQFSTVQALKSISICKQNNPTPDHCCSCTYLFVPNKLDVRQPTKNILLYKHGRWALFIVRFFLVVSQGHEKCPLYNLKTISGCARNGHYIIRNERKNRAQFRHKCRRGLAQKATPREFLKRPNKKERKSRPLQVFVFN